MDVLVPILFQLITGGAGGTAVGQISRFLNLGTGVNCLVGAVGGVAGVWLISTLPGLDSLVMATAGSPDAIAGIDPGALAGQGAIGLVSGGVLVAIIATIKSTVAKS